MPLENWLFRHFGAAQSAPLGGVSEFPAELNLTDLTAIERAFSIDVDRFTTSKERSATFAQLKGSITETRRRYFWPDCAQGMF